MSTEAALALHLKACSVCSVMAHMCRCCRNAHVWHDTACDYLKLVRSMHACCISSTDKVVLMTFVCQSGQVFCRCLQRLKCGLAWFSSSASCAALPSRPPALPLEGLSGMPWSQVPSCPSSITHSLCSCSALPLSADCSLYVACISPARHLYVVKCLHTASEW